MEMWEFVSGVFSVMGWDMVRDARLGDDPSLLWTKESSPFSYPFSPPCWVPESKSHTALNGFVLYFPHQPFAVHVSFECRRNDFFSISHKFWFLPSDLFIFSVWNKTWSNLHNYPFSFMLLNKTIQFLLFCQLQLQFRDSLSEKPWIFGTLFFATFLVSLAHLSIIFQFTPFDLQNLPIHRYKSAPTPIISSFFSIVLLLRGFLPSLSTSPQPFLKSHPHELVTHLYSV